MEFIEFVNEESLILIPVLVILGALIKKAEFIPNKFIPLSLLAIGVLLSIGTLGVNVDSVVQGILVTGAAVLSNQLVKQHKKPS